MLLSSYRNTAVTTASGLDDIKSTLSQTEQQLCNRLKLVHIIGKGNSSSRSVPVLLTTHAAAGVECLLKYRGEMGIDNQNPFVFARFKGLGNIDGVSSLRRIADAAQLERPELVRSTKLRKYVATVSQLLDMKSSEMKLLCQHLGHSTAVHDKYYRLPSETLELAKVSKFLLAVEGGDQSFLCGRNFDDIQLDDIPDVMDDEQDPLDLNSSTGPPEDEIVDDCPPTGAGGRLIAARGKGQSTVSQAPSSSQYFSVDGSWFS